MVIDLSGIAFKRADRARLFTE